MFNKKSLIICEDDKNALDLYNILTIQFSSLKITYLPAHDSLPFSKELSSADIRLNRSINFISGIKVYAADFPASNGKI